MIAMYKLNILSIDNHSQFLKGLCLNDLKVP